MITNVEPQRGGVETMAAMWIEKRRWLVGVARKHHDRYFSLSEILDSDWLIRGTFPPEFCTAADQNAMFDYDVRLANPKIQIVPYGPIAIFFSLDI